MGLRSAWKPCLNPHFSPKKEKDRDFGIRHLFGNFEYTGGFLFCFVFVWVFIVFCFGGLLF